jgi:hypothetical protein
MNQTNKKKRKIRAFIVYKLNQRTSRVEYQNEYIYMYNTWIKKERERL